MLCALSFCKATIHEKWFEKFASLVWKYEKIARTKWQLAYESGKMKWIPIPRCNSGNNVWRMVILKCSHLITMISLQPPWLDQGPVELSIRWWSGSEEVTKIAQNGGFNLSIADSFGWLLPRSSTSWQRTLFIVSVSHDMSEWGEL